MAIDASPGSLSAARAAARLAAITRAELSALFVEDSRMLSLSELPAARLGSFLLPLRRLQPGELEHQVRSQARRARLQLERIARHHRVACSFRTVRGPVESVILEAARESDLLALGRGGWPRPPAPGLGGTARRILGRARGRLLLLPESARLEPPVITLLDGSEGSWRAVELALELASHLEGELLVLLVAESVEAANGLRATLAERSAGNPARVHLARLGADRTAALSRLLREPGRGLLVLPDSPALDLREMAEAAPLPVLAVY